MDKTDCRAHSEGGDLWEGKIHHLVSQEERMSNDVETDESSGHVYTLATSNLGCM